MNRNLQVGCKESVTAKIPSINIFQSIQFELVKSQINEQVKYGCQWAIKHFFLPESNKQNVFPPTCFIQVAIKWLSQLNVLIYPEKCTE